MENTKMTIESYVSGTEKDKAHEALARMLQGLDEGVTYADVMRLRINGDLAAECRDVYYVAREGEKAISRLWTGWGKHEGAIGNWGNFFTEEASRGKGVGRQMLDFWQKDMAARREKPLCVLCTAANEGLVTVYGRYGFVRVTEGFRYLYKPFGDSPATFRAFCEAYYRPAAVLYHKAASFGYRHEIDCLLRFAFADLGLPFGIGEETGVENALLHYPHRAGLLFTPDGHCVGWSLDGTIQVHPTYAGIPVEDRV